MRREPLEHVVNLSVNQTLARTVITAGTTFLSVLALYLFGGEVLRGFAFTMIVGIISGTYSTRVHRLGDRHRPEPQAAARTAAGARPRPATRRPGQGEAEAGARRCQPRPATRS